MSRPEPLIELMDALDARDLDACNIARSGSGYQVSVRRRGSEGWSVFFGSDIGETIWRAIENGPQTDEGENMTLDEAMKGHPGWPVDLSKALKVPGKPTVNPFDQPASIVGSWSDLIQRWDEVFDATEHEPAVNRIDPNGDDTAD